jgi:hypothetical protein
MIKSLPAGPVPIQRDRVAQYLESLGNLCMECARRPELLPTFLRIIAMVPKTIEAMLRARQAAKRNRKK